MNIVFLMGRLVSDPQKGLSDSIDIAKFTIAVDRQYSKNNANKTDFFNVVAFKHVAKFVLEYGKKGNMITVQGKLRNNNYEKDGETIYQNQIIADKVSIPKT